MAEVKRIFLDIRESDNNFVTSFVDEAMKKGFDIVMRTLPIGDIQYQNIIIERKTIGDFYSSVAGDHLWNQIIHMKSNPEYNCIIVISGRLQEIFEVDETKINIVIGSQKKIMAMGIPLLWCHTSEELVSKVLELFEYASPINVPIKRVEKNNRLSLFIALPTVGKLNAEKLITRFKNIEILTRASEKEIQKIVGSKKGSIIYKALRE